MATIHRITSMLLIHHTFHTITDGEQEIGMETIIIIVSMKNTMIWTQEFHITKEEEGAHPMLSYIRMEELV